MPRPDDGTEAVLKHRVRKIVASGLHARGLDGCDVNVFLYQKLSALTWIVGCTVYDRGVVGRMDLPWGDQAEVVLMAEERLPDLLEQVAAARARRRLAEAAEGR